MHCCLKALGVCLSQKSLSLFYQQFSGMMEQTLSHKTVFVLDHSYHFSKASGIVVDYDLGSKNRTPGFIPLHPLSKSLWTWSVECVLEYCRMVYDIFPTNKHVRNCAHSVYIQGYVEKGKK